MTAGGVVIFLREWSRPRHGQRTLRKDGTDLRAASLESNVEVMDWFWAGVPRLQNVISQNHPSGCDALALEQSISCIATKLVPARLGEPAPALGCIRTRTSSSVTLDAACRMVALQAVACCGEPCGGLARLTHRKAWSG